MASLRISAQEERALRKRLAAAAAVGLLVPRDEPNPYLKWRYDGAAVTLQCYAGKKGLTVVANDAAIFQRLRDGHFDGLEPVSAREDRTGWHHQRNGRLRILTPDSGEGDTARGPRLRKGDLSRDQAEVFCELVRWARGTRGDLLSLGGYAGTGKSTLVSVLAREIEDDESIAFCAYTGKAASVLRRKLFAAGVDLRRHFCGTIHQLLYRAVADQTTGEILDWEPKRKLKHSLVVVDEASMVSREILLDMQAFGVRILAVGDHGQLPPVGATFHLMARPDLRLERIHRQAAGNPIIRLSAAVREGKELPDEITDDPRVDWQPGLDGAELDLLLGDLLETAEDAGDTAALCYFNATRVALNDRVRALFGMDDLLSPGETAICLRNTRFGPLLLANGMRGTVRSCSDDGAHHLRAQIDFPDDELRLEGRLSRAQFSQPGTFQSFLEAGTVQNGELATRWSDVGLLFDYGYAMTVHKAQGSQFDRVLLVLERSRHADDEHHRRWLYTAVTRAAERLVVTTLRR